MIGNLPWVREPVQLEDPWGMRHQIKSDDQLRVATPPSFSESIQGMPFLTFSKTQQTLLVLNHGNEEFLIYG